jgi:hypothetical protein
MVTYRHQPMDSYILSDPGNKIPDNMAKTPLHEIKDQKIELKEEIKELINTIDKEMDQ